MLLATLSKSGMGKSFYTCIATPNGDNASSFIRDESNAYESVQFKSDKFVGSSKYSLYSVIGIKF